MTENKTILFVDDEEVVLEVGARMLERLGYTVLTAGNPAAALDTFAAHHPGIDLVILDLIMPGMECEEILGRIRNVRSDTRILIASGYSHDERVKKIMENGCHGFIQKPFKLAELSRMIKEIIGEN